jgi:hypothetical protein
MLNYPATNLILRFVTVCLHIQIYMSHANFMYIIIKHINDAPVPYPAELSKASAWPSLAYIVNKIKDVTNPFELGLTPMAACNGRSR